MPTQFYSDLLGAAIVGDPDPQLVEFKTASGVVPLCRAQRQLQGREFASDE